MRQTLLRLPILASAVFTSLALQAQTPARTMGAPYQDASRAFIDFMIPHHDMAVMMAEHAVTSARSDAVKEMARKIAEAQKKEIAELKAARKTLFGSDSARTPMMRAMMEMMGMHQMMDSGASRAMMDSMHARHHPGQPPMGRHMMAGGFDHMFLQHMISHHQDGIEVSLLAEHSQATARVKELAKKTREGQEREIAELRRLLASLPGAPPAEKKP